MTDLSVPRDSRRVPLETRVQLKFDRFSGFISEFSSNLSPGGMFVRSESPEPVGTVVGFEFRLGDGFELIRGTGEVVWVRAHDDGPKKPAGMGIRFRELSPQSRDLIYKIVDNYIQEGGTPFELTKVGAALASVPAPAPEQVPVADPVPRARPQAGAPPIRSASSLLSLFEDEAPPAAPPAPQAPVAPAAPAATSPAAASPPAPEQPPPAAAAPMSLESLVAGAVPPLPPAAPLSMQRKAPAAPPVRTQPARRWGRLAAAVLVLLLVVAALGWRFREHWWIGGGGEEALADPLPAAFSRPGKGRPMAPPTRLPAERGITATAPASALAPVLPGPATGEPGVPAPGTAPAEEAALPLPAPAAAAAEEPPRAVLSRVERITWQALDGETEVTLWGDGIIRQPNWARFRVEGGSPRELIKLKGVRRPFASSRLAVGTAELLQVRVGYHAPSELHVVLDLADPAVKVAAVEEDATSLRLRLRRE